MPRVAERIEHLLDFTGIGFTLIVNLADTYKHFSL